MRIKYHNILLFIIACALNIGVASANKELKIFKVAYKHKLYYSSYIFLKKSLLKNSKISLSQSNAVLDTIHPSVFIHDNELDQFVKTNNILNYPVGLRYFFKNKFKIAKYKLKRIKKNDPFYMEANYILGLIELTYKKNKRANQHFKRCVRFSATKRISGIKTKEYIDTFKNRCIQQVARINFENKKYNTALKVLNYVEKTDYIWPRFILDKAWSYYWTDQNARALGSVITFRAPLLQRYMVPEASYLRSLIYYDMCYFEKSEAIYKEFKNTTWKYRNRVKSYSRNNLLKLITTRKEPKNEELKFLYYYLKGFKKDIRYFSYKNAQRQIYKEIKKLSKIKGLKTAEGFLENLYYYRLAIKEDFLDFLKRIANDYYSQIVQMRRAFVKLDLMISLKKRKHIKSAQKRNVDILDLSLSSIANVKDKFIWDFQGGFWADELGDYAVALENRCSNE